MFYFQLINYIREIKKHRHTDDNSDCTCNVGDDAPKLHTT